MSETSTSGQGFLWVNAATLPLFPFCHACQQGRTCQFCVNVKTKRAHAPPTPPFPRTALFPPQAKHHVRAFNSCSLPDTPESFPAVTIRPCSISPCWSSFCELLKGYLYKGTIRGWNTAGINIKIAHSSGLRKLAQPAQVIITINNNSNRT